MQMASKKTTPVPSFLVRDPQTGTLSLISTQKGKDTLTAQPPATRMSRAAGRKKQVLILGGGISGLTAAYDLLKRGEHEVTIIEANGRTGGRSLTLRNGDSFTEVHGRETWTQECVLETAKGAPYNAYLNAGPGRIPSAHYHVLNLCKELAVDLEVYIMQSRSNLVEGQGGPMVNRRVANDVIGYIAQDLFQFLLRQGQDPNTNKYMQLLIQTGALTVTRERDRIVNALYNGSQRSGYKRLPDTQPGELVMPIEKDKLVSSEFWKYHFYQPEDFLWQATSFQPVGGMDMIEKALLDKIYTLGGKIILNAPVQRVVRTGSNRWEVLYKKDGQLHTIAGDSCLCNIPIPLMKGKLDLSQFSDAFRRNVERVRDARDFLAPTCKVGWQAPRELWQKLPTNPNDAVIPIFGGISYTRHPMTQMWYPSDRFHDVLGVLTGAYNYGDDAARWGTLSPAERLAEAKEGARQLHGQAFANGLRNGITIAWQNIPTQKGGWVDWSKVPVEGRNEAERNRARAAVMNAIRRGDRNFYFIGDQVSWLPGWKEGAVAVAQEVYALITKMPGFAMLQIEQVPDTQALVQGHTY